MPSLPRNANDSDPRTYAIAHSQVTLHPDRYIVAQVTVPPACQPPHFLVCTDHKEITVITVEERATELEGVISTRGGYRLIEFATVLPFSAPGFLATISRTIAAQGMNILIYSTFSTDYILLREEDHEQGLLALRRAGFMTDPLAP